MDMLYAPWREDYAKKIAQGPKGQECTTPESCIFCILQSKNNDEESFILKRYMHCYVILNRYPYNPGHLLIIPYDHKKYLSELTQETSLEIMDLLNTTTEIVQKEMEPQGINIGLNMGKAAGAGIPSHLHWHILPRWLGDTNFLPTLAGVKTVSTDLPTLYKQLLTYFR